MTIHLTLNAETVDELHAQMRAMLGSTAIVTAAPSIVPEASNNEPRMTAAQKKAAEKAAKEAAEKLIAAAQKGPETAEDIATAEQDAKDEAADTAKSAPEPLKLTHDHVRKLLGGYVMAYGMENAQADGPTLLGVQKISEVPDEQPALAKAILSIASGIEKNPQKREMSGDGITKEKIDELKPFVEAAKAVK